MHLPGPHVRSYSSRFAIPQRTPRFRPHGRPGGQSLLADPRGIPRLDRIRVPKLRNDSDSARAVDLGDLSHLAGRTRELPTYERLYPEWSAHPVWIRSRSRTHTARRGIQPRLADTAVEDPPSVAPSSPLRIPPRYRMTTSPGIRLR
jgi:hypothetical protein